MNDALSARARELLEALVCGDLAPDAPEVIELSQRDAAFAERLRELESVTALLSETAAEELVTRSEAAQLRNAPGEELLARTVGREDAAQRAPRASVLAWLGGVAAVAAVLAAVFMTIRSRVEPQDPPIFMGNEPVRILAPRDTLSERSPITWEGRLPEGGQYRVYVRDEHGAGLLPVHTTRETSWSPAWSDLPGDWETLVIDIELRGRDGSLLGSDSVSIRRST